MVNAGAGRLYLPPFPLPEGATTGTENLHKCSKNPKYK